MSKLIPSTDPILHTPAKPVELIKEASLIKELTKIMVKEKGAGIAAPQIGESKNLFLVWDFQFDRVTVFANAQIYEPVSQILTCKMNEGCLSFPNLIVEVERPVEIEIEYSYLTLWGEELRTKTRVGGLTARIIQHEYDHVMGITFDQRGRIINEISDK